MQRNNMYCPKCATAITSENLRFCPACGLALADIVSIVSGNDPLAHPSQTPVQAVVDENHHRREAFKRWGTMVVMFSLMVGCLIPIAVGFRNYAPVFASLIVILAGVAGLLLFGGSSLIVYGDMLPKVPKSKRPTESPALHEALATTALPPAEPFNASVVATSVTDQTTRNLESVPAKRQRIHSNQ